MVEDTKGITVKKFDDMPEWYTQVCLKAELADYGLQTSDRSYLAQILDGLGGDPRVAYIAVLDMKREALAERRFAPGLAKAALPAMDAGRFQPTPGPAVSSDVTIDGQRYIELVGPVVASKPPA